MSNLHACNKPHRSFLAKRLACRETSRPPFSVNYFVCSGTIRTITAFRDNAREGVCARNAKATKEKRTKRRAKQRGIIRQCFSKRRRLTRDEPEGQVRHGERSGEGRALGGGRGGGGGAVGWKKGHEHAREAWQINWESETTRETPSRKQPFNLNSIICLRLAPPPPPPSRLKILCNASRRGGTLQSEWRLGRRRIWKLGWNIYLIERNWNSFLFSSGFFYYFY